MPRRFRVFRQNYEEDPIYKSSKVAMLINRVMMQGQKHKASRIVYDAFDIASEKLKKDPLEIFDTVLANVTPLVEVRSRRIGGAAYQIPTEIRPHRKMSLALRWIVNFSRARHGMPMAEKLAAEFIDAYNNTGASVKKKEETHKMADANKALAHFSKY